MENAVEISNVVKRFQTKLAVDNFSIQIPQASVFGFIGPNGSGKTTTIRMILRIIEPDSGTISVLGRSKNRAANDDIAYLPEERGLYRKMTVLKQLVYFGKLKGMSSRSAKEAAMHWLERMELAEWKDKKLESLSKGMSQKIQFITTVMSRPRLLILDEPFSGLDPVNLEVLRKIILELKSEGTTILFSTHDMHTAEQMCDHIAMIYNGKQVLDGSLDQIQAKYGQDTIRIGLAGQTAFDPTLWSGVENARNLGRYWEIRYTGDSQELLKQAMTAGQIERFEIVHPSLHDIFVRIATPAKRGQSEMGSLSSESAFGGVENV